MEETNTCNKDRNSGHIRIIIDAREFTPVNALILNNIHVDDK